MRGGCVAGVVSGAEKAVKLVCCCGVDSGADCGLLLWLLFFLFFLLCFLKLWDLKGLSVLGTSSPNLDDNRLTSGYRVRNSSIVSPEEEVGEWGSVLEDDSLFRSLFGSFFCSSSLLLLNLFWFLLLSFFWFLKFLSLFFLSELLELCWLRKFLLGTSLSSLAVWKARGSCAWDWRGLSSLKSLEDDWRWFWKLGNWLNWLLTVWWAETGTALLSASTELFGSLPSGPACRKFCAGNGANVVGGGGGLVGGRVGGDLVVGGGGGRVGGGGGLVGGGGGGLVGGGGGGLVGGGGGGLVWGGGGGLVWGGLVWGGGLVCGGSLVGGGGGLKGSFWRNSSVKSLFEFCSSLILSTICLKNFMISCWLCLGASRISRMVWAEDWSWDNNLWSLTFSGSFTGAGWLENLLWCCWGWLCWAWLGSSLPSACFALFPLLLLFWCFAFLSLLEEEGGGFSTRMERGILECSSSTKTKYNFKML